MNRLSLALSSELETERFGAALAQCLPDRAVVAIRGTLGAGKTRLVQAVAQAAGVDRRQVVSPTFVLVHEYHGRRTVYHIDAYRIGNEDEFFELGPDEYFAAPAWTLIEWADRVEACLPEERLDVELELTGPTSRRLELVARGERYKAVVAAIRSGWERGDRPR